MSTLFEAAFLAGCYVGLYALGARQIERWARDELYNGQADGARACWAILCLLALWPLAYVPVWLVHLA